MTATKTVPLTMVAVINPNKCIICETCLEVCPVEAIGFPPGTGTYQAPEVDWMVCRGCGLCAEECLNGAITLEEPYP
jgi:Pyruvate/2-oxoacid:ferredoxin oxidoreductase delta subunit